MNTPDLTTATTHPDRGDQGPRTGSVEYWAGVRPAVTAVVEGGRTWTWLEWNDAADRLACALDARGLRAGDVIALRAQVRFEWCVVAAAAAKLQCTLLCLNWRLTTSETAYILANAGARAIVCDDEDPLHVLDALPSREPVIAVSIDRACEGFLDWSELLATAPRAFFSIAPAPQMIYTSGTTGLPKGVLGGQATSAPATVRAEYVEDMLAHGQQRAGDVALITVPLHHGLGASLVHRAIEHGNQIVLMRRYDPEQALAAIQGHRVSFWFAVPTMIKRMAMLPAETVDAYDVSSIRSIMTGASPVPIDVKRWVIEHFGPCLTESYGSTETSLITYLPPAEQLRRPGSSGKPYRHVAIKIVDDAGKVLGPGESGEIFASTPVTISAYVGCELLGPETRDSEGFFRVGDAGYLDEEGYLYITGRVKDMIISGGVNIYPAEIEAVLLSHPEVADVAVIGIPNDEYGEEVIGFYESKPGKHPREEDLLALCRTSLASYKRPRRLTAVDELPRNTMGKVLKQQLRAPYWTGHSRQV